MKRRGESTNKPFTTKEEFINNLYSAKWKLSNSSTRSNSVSLIPLYQLGLSDEVITLLLRVFKYWAMTTSPSTAGTRISAVCKIIKLRGEMIISNLEYLKVNYNLLTTSNKKNLNYLFRALYDIFNISSFKEQRQWTLHNLDIENVNPHDPVNGAYSDYQFNKIIDRSSIILEECKELWLRTRTVPNFQKYSYSLFDLLSLITSRRAAQFVQLKIVDVQPCNDNSYEEKLVGELIELKFHKSKSPGSGFRGKPEHSAFPLSLYFSKVVLIYLYELKELVKSLCVDYKVDFEDIEWSSFPLFPSINSVRSADDLVSTSIHTDRLHRIFRRSKSDLFSIARVRHTTITRGMEMGLSSVELSRLTGVTTAATRNYKDLTPKSRHLINSRFCKNELLFNSFSWTVSEYERNFERVFTDEFGQGIGGIEKGVGCRSCSKQLGAPLGCYTCGADAFVPFLEGNHGAQLSKAKAKKLFLETTGANRHQLFEISFIIKRIEQVIFLQRQHGYYQLDE